MSYSKKRKVYPKHRISKANTINKSYYTTSKITLEGNYLRDAGFHPNDEIEIDIGVGEIKIKKVD